MPVSTAVKLDEETRRRLKALGEQIERSPHWIMKRAIIKYLDAQEEEVRERREDMERWERFVTSGVAVQHGEVVDWLESWGADDEKPCPAPG